jgi:hypothetical protein
LLIAIELVGDSLSEKSIGAICLLAAKAYERSDIADLYNHIHPSCFNAAELLSLAIAQLHR